MALYSWEGKLLPASDLPKMGSGSSSYYIANYLIYQKGGTYYCLALDWTGIHLFYVVESQKRIFLQQNGYQWTLVNGKWTDRVSAKKYEKDENYKPVTDENGIYVNGHEYDELIWTNKGSSYGGGVNYYSRPGMNGDRGVALYASAIKPKDISKNVKDISSYTLEPLPSPVVEVSGWGNTGVTVGAQIREPVTNGEVIDVSDRVQYGIHSIGAAYASIDGSRQLIVDPAAPFGSLGINITWSELPGQTATISVRLAANSGGGSGGSGGTGGGTGGGDGGDITTSLITNIELHIHPDEVFPGLFAVANVIVSGTGDYDRDFTATIVEATSAETCFVKGSSYHNIFVGKDETAEYILVTVASVQDPTMTATEMIYINHSVTDDGSGDAEQLQLAYWKGYSAAKAMYGGGR